MKFKTIFLVFNIIIIFSFLVIFFMPFFLFNSSDFSGFFPNNWLALFLFALVLLIFNSYFIGNFKLFSLLEEENWIDLIKYLEQQIYTKHRLHISRLKILLNAYLVTTSTASTLKLEKHLAQIKPVLVGRFAIQFSVPYLFNNEPASSEAFFSQLLANPRVPGRDWIRWNYALSLVQQQKLEEGRQLFVELLEGQKDPILFLLSLYILKSFAVSEPELREKIEAGIFKLRGQYNILTWPKMVETRKVNVEVLVLSKIIEQAGEWLFKTTKLEDPFVDDSVTPESEPEEQEPSIIN